MLILVLFVPIVVIGFRCAMEQTRTYGRGVKGQRRGGFSKPPHNPSFIQSAYHFISFSRVFVSIYLSMS
jgi:hypothetical protein